MLLCMVFSRNRKYSAGVASKKLSYYDGILKLVYKGGDSYHSTPPVNCSSEIVFICDNTAGDGRPYFKAETDHTYTFEWYTALACLPRTVGCSVADEDSGLYYDLTRLDCSVNSILLIFSISQCTMFLVISSAHE